VQERNGLAVPETLDELCAPARCAVVVYDMQQGIAPHVRDAEALTRRVGEVLDAAREAGVLVAYMRHTSLPVEAMGVSQLRVAMAWQRVRSVSEVRSLFPPDSDAARIIPEVAPRPAEPVFDKLGMSAFAGTPLDIALRDRGVGVIALVGAVLEIGIEPTARHAADLGYVPVVVTDACGVVDAEAAARSVASLDYSLLCERTDAAALVAAWRRG
jgi:nicotinamidase-related amidase